MKKYEDLMLDVELEMIRQELCRAKDRFRDFHSGQEGWAIIYEEVCELHEAVRKNDLENARQEALQVAAMALRFLMDIRTKEKMSNRRES